MMTLFSGRASCRGIFCRPASSKIIAAGGNFVATVKNPTDPLFYADIYLQNIVPGSRYWIAQASDLTNVLATGVADTAELTLENIPSYDNPMLIEIRVRNASGTPAYDPYKTYRYLAKEGITIYIAQVEDTVNA
jgi:hypothetical protein